MRRTSSRNHLLPFLISLAAISPSLAGAAPALEVLGGVVEPVTSLGAAASEEDSNRQSMFTPMGAIFFGGAARFTPQFTVGGTLGLWGRFHRGTVANLFLRSEDLFSAASAIRIGLFSTVGITEVKGMVARLSSVRLPDTAKVEVRLREADTARYWHLAAGPGFTLPFLDDQLALRLDAGLALNLGKSYRNANVTSRIVNDAKSIRVNNAERRGTGAYTTLSIAWRFQDAPPS